MLQKQIYIFKIEPIPTPSKRGVSLPIPKRSICWIIKNCIWAILRQAHWCDIRMITTKFQTLSESHINFGNLQDSFYELWRQAENIGFAKLLKRLNVSQIFHQKEKTTQGFLEERNFSNGIIEHFFRPFLGGIFFGESIEDFESNV